MAFAKNIAVFLQLWQCQYMKPFLLFISHQLIVKLATFEGLGE